MAGLQGVEVRIGNVVFFQGRLTLATIGTESGNIKIDGLNYNNASGNAFSPVNVGYGGSLAITAGNSVGGYIGDGSKQITLRLWDDVFGQTNMQASELSTNGSLAFSGWYITDDDF